MHFMQYMQLSLPTPRVSLFGTAWWQAGPAVEYISKVEDDMDFEFDWYSKNILLSHMNGV